MAVLSNFSLGRYEDGVLTIGLTPEVPIGGWSIEFTVTKRFGGVTDLVTRSMAPGFQGVSGMTTVNSGQGVMSIQIHSTDMSGQEYGNYAFLTKRLDSGSMTNLTEGFLTLTP